MDNTGQATGKVRAMLIPPVSWELTQNSFEDTSLSDLTVMKGRPASISRS
jgi:hypothetical protein